MIREVHMINRCLGEFGKISQDQVDASWWLKESSNSLIVGGNSLCPLGLNKEIYIEIAHQHQVVPYEWFSWYSNWDQKAVFESGGR